MPIWLLPEPGSRRAAYTREQIAEVAVAICDAEGYSALSMRRVASELGAGTMTLYHYIRDKDDLLALIDNAIMAEVILDEKELEGDWRDALAAIARRTRRTLTAHPWTSDVPPGDRGGPNGLRHFEQSLKATGGTGLPIPERLELIGLVDDFAFGSALRENMARSELEASGADRYEEMDLHEGEWSYFTAELERGDYPEVKSWLGDDPRTKLRAAFDTFNEEGRFERGLQTLLDGIEKRISDQRKAARKAKRSKGGN